MVDAMAMFQRPFVAFDGECYAIRETMMFIRAMFDMDTIPEEIYEAMMSKITELKVGYPYTNGDMINSPEGGFMTLQLFFYEFGYRVSGGRNVPLTIYETDEEEYEEEKKDEEESQITLDLEAEGHFLDELDALHLMRDEIQSDTE